MMNYNTGPERHPFEEARRFFREGSVLSLLILLNVSVWALIQVLKVFVFFLHGPGDDPLTTGLLHSLAIPASLPVLVLKPWTLVTYMFLHFDFWHILFNMMWLFWFGKIFLEFLPSRQLLLIYLLGGISGGVVYVLAFNAFPVFSGIVGASWALGASASVMAIVTAISVYVPNYTIQLLLIGRLKIFYLALILFVFDFFMIPSGNAGGHLAHIGGAIFGAVYIMAYGYSVKAGPGSILDHFRNLFKSKQAPHSENNTWSQTGRPMTDDEYNTRKRDNQRRIDEILEKISKGGYDSLTREEKDFLFKSSNKN